MGMLPSSQYGSVATLASSSMASLTSNHVVAWVTSDGAFPTGVANPSGTKSAETYDIAPSAGRGLYINSDSPVNFAIVAVVGAGLTVSEGCCCFDKSN